MSLARNFFYFSCGGAVLVMVAGTVASPLAGCDRSFCLSPVLSFGGQVLGVSAPTQSDTKTPTEPVTTTPQPTIDYRLSECPDGSIEPTAPDIPSTLARQLQKEIKQGLKLGSLVEVQGRLGAPKCNYREGESVKWRYLIRGSGGIVATESKGSVKVDFFGF